MAQALLLVRLVLAATFSLAGLAKLLDPSAAPRLSEYAGLPKRARPVVRVLPVAELAVAAGLLATRTTRLAAGVATAMLIGFTALIARRVAAHDSRSCGCFGHLDVAVLSRHPLARNAVMLGASLVVLVGGAGWPLGALGHHPAWLAALLAPAAAVAIVLLLRRHGDPRAAVPSLRELAAGAERTVVAILEPGCAACRTLLPALQRFDGAAGLRLVLVTRSPHTEDDDFRAATTAAARHVVDGGALVARYAIDATPAALVLGRGGSLERVVVGAPGVQALIEPDPAPGAATPEADARDVISRRHFVAAGVAVAAALPRFSLLDGLRTRIGLSPRTAGVACPSCGSCVICDAPAGSSKLHCRPCSQHCSGLKLCKSFANEFAPFTALAQHLRDLGYSQDGEMVTHGLERAGKLVVLSGSTPFAGRSASTPRALLIYSLVESGQSAWVALLDAKGAVRSVTTVAGGQVVTAAVTPPPASAAKAGARAGAGAGAGASTPKVLSEADSVHAARPLAPNGGPEPLAASPFGCADVCSFALGVVASLLALPFGIVTAPETAALGFAASLFAGGIGMADTRSGAALSALFPLVQGASLVSGVIDGLEGLDNALGQTAFCKDYACKLLTFCCNYNGVCNESDAQCEHDCPGGLAHPLAHCDAYLGGKRVSSLIVP